MDQAIRVVVEPDALDRKLRQLGLTSNQIFTVRAFKKLWQEIGRLGRLARREDVRAVCDTALAAISAAEGRYLEQAHIPPTAISLMQEACHSIDEPPSSLPALDWADIRAKIRVLKDDFLRDTDISHGQIRHVGSTENAQAQVLVQAPIRKVLDDLLAAIGQLHETAGMGCIAQNERGQIPPRENYSSA